MVGFRQLVEAGGWWRLGQFFPQKFRRIDIAREGPWPKVSDDQRALLARTIEGEIIPRLMLAHRVAPESLCGTAIESPLIDAESVFRLARLAVKENFAAAMSYVAELRDKGISIETLFLDLLTPAARHLGDLWRADLMSFGDVTIGLSRLQQVLSELGPEFEIEDAARDTGWRALLAPLPGDQHTFGVRMLEEFFRRAGWDVWVECTDSDDDIASLLKREWFSVLGLSASCDALPEHMASVIQSARRVSLNPDLVIMVGGRLFLEHPELVVTVGADATATDGLRAVREAPQLIRGGINSR